MKKILFLALTFVLFASWVLALSPEYQEVVERNIFSRERKYEPFNKEEPQKKNFKEEEIKKGVILRGIYRTGNETYVLFDIRPYLRKKLEIDEKKKFFRPGDKLGPCTIAKIEKGKVMLDEECNELILSFGDSPERKRPAPRPAPPPPPKPQKTQKPTQTKVQNPFKVFFKKHKQKN